MLVAKNISLSFGSRQVLRNLTVSLLGGERIALVGQNGEGKSTLLKIMAGQIPPDSGSVETKSRYRIGFLQQEPQLDDNDTVEDAVRKGMHDAPDYRVAELISRFHVNTRVDKVGQMSGGEKRRVDLARVMLSDPDVLLLDEPTNHLDIDAIRYLGSVLTSSPRPVLFISHDRMFIDDVATRILEIDGGELFTHDAPYANYLENRLIRMTVMERTLHRKERLIVRELAWLRAGTPARTTKQSARISRAETMIDEAKVELEQSRVKSVNLQSGNLKRLGKTILELRDVGFAYGDKTLFEHVNMIVTAGERFGILGANGAGKTTLLSIITGSQQPTSGQVVRGKNTEVIQFDQNRRQLDPEMSLKETLAEQGDTVFIGDQRIHIASYLERFLFDPADMNRKVSTLSGGEQNRLLLAKLFRHGANCLLLDEPTNDLDVSTLGVLEETLQQHEGVAFIVSHDRRFLDRVCTAILAFEGTSVVLYQGNYTNYVSLSAKPKLVTSHLRQGSGGQAPKATVQRTKRSFNEEREYVEIEAKIAKAEAEREALQALLSDGTIYRTDPAKAKDSAEKLEAIEREIELLYERWQYLER